MPKTLVINSNNYVKNSGNRFQYTFPGAGIKFQATDKIGVQQINIFNSTFNISKALSNNTFSVIWNANFSDASTTKTYNFTIPDGYYTVSQLNYFLQDCLFKNKLYLINGTSNASNIYFLTFTTNSIYYALEIDTYALPTTSTITTLGYTYPANCGWTVKSTVESPQITLGSGLLTWFGFATQTTFPTLATTTSNQQFLSDTSPIVNPVNSIIFTCNMISSPYSSPSNFFYSMPLSSTFGTLLTVNNSFIVYQNVLPATYTSMIIELYDQNYTPLQMVDKELLLVISVDSQ